MLLCAAGDIHGALDRLYTDVLAFEAALAVRFEWVLHVGDFGVWPDATRVDRATRDHDGAGDFPAWFSERRAAPRKTIFIKGNHEDFVRLDAQANREVLPGQWFLPNGSTFDLGGVTVGGVGGCHGPSDYGRRARELRGYAKRHYTREDVDRLIAAGHVDVRLTHDAPAGVVFPRHRQGANWASTAAGLDDLVRAVRPGVCFSGHHHTRVEGQVDGVPCLGPEPRGEAREPRGRGGRARGSVDPVGGVARGLSGAPMGPAEAAGLAEQRSAGGGSGRTTPQEGRRCRGGPLAQRVSHLTTALGAG